MHPLLVYHAATRCQQSQPVWRTVKSHVVLSCPQTPRTAHMCACMGRMLRAPRLEERSNTLEDVLREPINLQSEDPSASLAKAAS